MHLYNFLVVLSFKSPPSGTIIIRYEHSSHDLLKQAWCHNWIDQFEGVSLYVYCFADLEPAANTYM